MTSDARAQRLIDEFTESAALDGGGFSVRHGIAAVLRHIIATEQLHNGLSFMLCWLMFFKLALKQEKTHGNGLIN